MSERMLDVSCVSKKFCKDDRKAMFYSAIDIARTLVGLSQKADRLRDREFWSVKDVSFSLKRGDCLGLVGPNGAGKSTLLQMLSGIVTPDNGTIMIKGKVGALIAIGAGFHPLLTGRENVYVNGAILGFSKKDIDIRFREIVEFSEIGEFIDMPVKHYSSGMYMRLGFSLAIHLEPDVLLVDEVLAVGDVGFKAKCHNAIARIAKDAAVVFVSHSMPQVARICNMICVMDHGNITYLGGDVPKGIDTYYSCFKQKMGIVSGSGKAAINAICIYSSGMENPDRINYYDDLEIHVTLSVQKQIEAFAVNVSFLSRELQIIAQCNSMYNKFAMGNTGETMHVIMRLPHITLNPGSYMVSVGVTGQDLHEVFVNHYAAKELRVSGDFMGAAPVQFNGVWEVF